MIIVLDANVIVAAFATRGLCSDLFKFCISRHKIAVSQSLLNEIREILIKKIKLPLGEANAVSGYLKEAGILSAPVLVNSKACRDPSDLHILGLAQAVEAQIIVTGDQDLLILKRFLKTKILSPREFWEKREKL